MEFSVGTHKYRNNRMDVITAYDVARRWTPVLALLAMRIKEKKGDKTPPTDEQMVRAIVAASSNVLKEHHDFVLQACLETVYREDNGKWQHMSPAGSGRLQYEDLSINELVEIQLNVIRDNGLLDFFSEAPTA